MTTLSIFLSIGSIIIFFSLIGVIILWNKLKEIHQEKPHIISKVLPMAAFLVIIIHIISLIITIGLIFFYDDIKALFNM